MSHQPDVMEKIVALCRRRGFIFQSSEIYGGIGGFWDYGPLGSQLKKNIKDAWWHDMVEHPPIGPEGRELQMVGVDCSIIMNPKVWEASGHLAGFSDPMRDCKQCKRRFRADWLTWHGLYEVTEIPNLVSEADLYAIHEKQPSAVFFGEAVIPATSFSDAVKRVLKVNKVKWETRAREGGSDKWFCSAGSKHYYLGLCLDGGPSHQEVCFHCGGELTEPRAFNLMFTTHVGAVEEASSVAYLRPETAQGIFANFKNVIDSTRVKIPFGIAQMGKAFRNEINPRNFTFRSREFEQMEIEFFCHERDSLRWWEWWRDVRINWYKSLGLSGERLRPRNQTEKELAHYSKACTDIEYLFPFSDEPQELEGVAHRGCYDLSQHGKFAKGDENAFSYFDDETKERFVPHVIEPSAGADRFTLAVICEAYTHDPERASPEFMKFHPRLAPIKAAVFPLVAKDGLPEIADPIFREIRKQYSAQYDPKQSIGKRYARMDEAGTPFCFTIDGQTKEDGTVTVRDRDTGSQMRIDKSRVVQYLKERL